MTAIDLADVQGFILRGYRVEVARHFMLKIVQPAAARQFLTSLISGDPNVPQITTAAPWTTKPDVFLNVGLTYTGLAALNLDAASLKSFPPAFTRGATSPTSASNVGDIGESAPANWVGGLSDANNIHVVLSLWAMHQEALEAASARLRAAFQPGLAEQSAHEADALPHNMVHFGYRDNIAQPTVDGAPMRKHEHRMPDDQPIAPTGEFLMGYPSQNPGGAPFNVSPPQLSTNSSFGAFRILAQDVVGFEQFLTQAAQDTGLHREMIAAKVCGRWRNGVPLSLSPDQPQTEPPVPYKQFNNFTYVVPDNPQQDDTLGFKCPIGSHIRRSNPRSEAVAGGPSAGHTHRITRRAMPYGPPYDPTHPDPDPAPERGLIGWFINVSLDYQFEFVMNSWINTDTFVMSVKLPDGNPVKNISGQDVILGSNNPHAPTSFTIPMPGKNLTVKGFKSFVTTRGGVYCYFPSITAIKYLAALPDSA